jgi:exodeoxyribonuclease VII large subunit
LPIISGIGHQRDVSILDTIAHTSVKTPTAAAEFLISNLCSAENQTTDIFSNIQFLIKNRLENESRYLENAQLRIKHALKNKLNVKFFALENQKRRLHSGLRMFFVKQHNKLNLLEKNIETYSPAFLLQHGYTIATLNGKRIVSAKNIKKGDMLRTYFPDGAVNAVVDNVVDLK